MTSRWIRPHRQREPTVTAFLLVAFLLALLASAFVAWPLMRRRAQQPTARATALLVVLLPIENAPIAAAVDCVPLSAPPEVLTQTWRSVSGLCQKLGSTSITTWYWFMSL